MRRILGVGLAALLVAAGCSDDGGTTEDGSSAAPTTTVPTDSGPTLGPLVSGTASIIDGTYVWTDYAYDDRGPNEDGEPGGDAVYVDGWRNEADLIQLQLGLDDEGRVTVRAVLETLTDPAVPTVVVAFDTDGDPGTGDELLPGLEGMETSTVLQAEGGALTGVDRSEDLEVTVDLDTNSIEATLPLEPDGATWRAVGIVATEGGDEPHDLAFVGDEREYRWQDDVQADVLGGTHVPDAAVAEIDFGQLADGGTELADATAPGFHTYLYESELELGEGVAPDAEEEDGLEYRGPYQPYLVWIPDDGAAEGEPMTLFLHGLTQNHLGSVITPDGTHIGTGRPLSEEIDDLAQYARDGLDFPPHNLTVWPLARGEGLRYRGIAEQDALDVLADATERFAPDPDRIILSGASMGGIGTFRLGALYPDRFSVAAPIIGLATDDTVPLLTNLWNVPLRQLNGSADPLIPADAATATTDELDELELAFRAWMIDGRGHEAGGYVYDCVYASLPEFERVNVPADVRYTVDPAQFVSDPASGLELVYDGAYWISGMEVADSSRTGSVLAFRSDGDDAGAYRIDHVDRRGESGPDGGDLCGPNPDVRTGDTWRERAVERTPQPSTGSDVGLDLGMRNLAAVTVDLADGSVRDGGSIAVVADGPGEVTITGLEPGTMVTIGDESGEADADGSVTLTVVEGQTEGSIG